MNKTLTFRIERRGDFDVLVYNYCGCRPATNEEMELWNALLAAQQPEPRAEVTDDDKLDAERYRLLKSIPFGSGVPAIYRGIAFSFAVPTNNRGFIRSCRGEEMDTAIDAARATQRR